MTEKIRSTEVDVGDLKHELLNRLMSTVALKVLKCVADSVIDSAYGKRSDGGTFSASTL